MTRPLPWLALALCACASGPLDAAEVRTPGPAVRASRQLIEQKLAFLKGALSDSPALRRIEAGDSAEARKLLAAAQENYRNAVLSFKNNDLAGADKQLNVATSLIGKARQLAPDATARNVEHRVRYAQMLESVESLRISYQRQLQRAKPPRGEVEGDALLVNVVRLIDDAKGLAKAEQVARANQTLAEAERSLMTGISRALGSKTIEYAQRFDTPVDEYDYELDRNRSYAELIPIALSEFKPGVEAVREAQGFLNANRGLREQAQQRAAAKDYRAALAALRNGTTQLQKGLAAAGLRVPPDPKSQ